MLVHLLRSWPNIKTTLCQRLTFTGYAYGRLSSKRMSLNVGSIYIVLNDQPVILYMVAHQFSAVLFLLNENIGGLKEILKTLTDKL